MKAVAIALGAAVLVAAAGYGLRDHIGSLPGIGRDPIRARITLQNRCNVTDRSFVVRDVQTGRYASFRGGVAVIDTVEHNRLRVEIAPHFRDVDLNGQSAPARREMTLTAKCGSKLWNKDNFARD